MKLLLTSLLSLLLGLGYANDTLTRAQVYNFNIGDTFDYKIEGDHNCPPIAHGVSYDRVVITNLRYTAGNNTLVIYRQHLDGSNDSLAIDSLNKYAIDQDYNVCNRNYWIDTAQTLSGSLCNAPPRIFNGVSYNTCVEGSYYYRYGEGLGEIISSVSGGDGTCGSSTLTTLIYYAKGTEHCGTPYYTLNGQTLIHFTPLPEECAVWTSLLWKKREQIRTGQVIEAQGHAYVEMIYSAYDSVQNAGVYDSLIGYFRNDTIAEKTLFYNSITANPFFEYDYKSVIGGFNGFTNCTAIDQVTVNGQLKTRWQYAKYGDWQPFDQPHLYYVEGIGGLNGLFPVSRSEVVGWPNYIANFPRLTCFSVCGQTIYPNATTTSCELISGITETEAVLNAFKLTPNPSSSAITISTNGVAIESIGIYNTAGQLLLLNKQPLNNTIDISSLSSGVYIAEIKTKEGSAMKRWVKM